jgi:hypothetical protein
MFAPAPPAADSVARRLAFRLIAAYLLVSNAEAVLRILPWMGSLSWQLTQQWEPAVHWVERVVIRMPESVQRQSGSGDTEYLWMRFACMVAMALVIGLAWFLVDRKRRYDRLACELLRVGVRYSLSVTMLGYGIAKLAPPSQFPAPWLGRLLEPVGRMSPMGILWTFMGASAAYTMFSGIMEVVSGLLLLFRKTTPLGASLATAVLTNIVLLNFCYDVPVKLYSSNLLFLALFLLWPDMRRLANVLVLNRTAEAAPIAPPWRGRVTSVIAAAAKIVIIGSLLYSQSHRYKDPDSIKKTPPASVVGLAGLWDVGAFTRDGVALPPLVTDRTRWLKVAIGDRYGTFIFYSFGAQGQIIGGWTVDGDSTDKQFVLVSGDKGEKRTPLAVAVSGPDKLRLSGKIDGHALTAELKRSEKDDQRLFNRGFHWVSEYPFNR